ncbi:MAG: carbohydrate kinase family protein [Chloroflexi bacterium AL-W]|nr:carbohydrate kinase family protein [Chloroflexi bacterium AL-N1]NOK65590.1 carbohydrate kinase family protein [Chloroflexi bacterium AL-N10]NOK74469.1 carbohydrate kinase family protein [Chloroflexi bacterium AL-N5]NOK80623.1 carbohydrate kinase family protein [Chloroflexi bacterium AL-W]NOK88727.1 carbohydrate kinase family protein [Chloroflexi bacterium AL-N15]
MRIVVTGSLAYDYIMNFPGRFTDHILADKTDNLSVSFLVDSMRRLRGGVAGNIAYTLALLGERPLIVATAGQDFGEYRTWMDQQGIDVSGIVEITNEFTASCFINTDVANSQIVAFYTGAMAYAKDCSVRDIGLTGNDLVIISPTDPEAMVRYTDECRELGIPFLFDPGKQTPRLDAEQIMAGLEGVHILIGNDYEFAMMAQKTGRSEADLIALAPLTIVTRGERGSVIYTNDSDGQGIDIPVVPIEEVRDPTGAGDAYLGGFAFSLARGFSLPTAGRIAALASAYTIEESGCQEHHYTLSAFVERFTQTFGPSSEVDTLLEHVEK